MSDTVEKIYCTDNNDALLASVMGKNNNNPMAMAAMLNNNQWMNNAITQLASNLNCDFNSLNNAICAVRSGIQDVAGKVGYSAARLSRIY